VSLEVLSRIVRCRELLEDDALAELALVLADLERDLAGDFRHACQRFRCPDCSAEFRWPGQVADHLDNVHRRAAA
jgi:hypothetical protein